MTKVRRVARRQRPLVALLVWCSSCTWELCIEKGRERGQSDKTQLNDCKGRLYSMSEELSRSAQLPVKSLVCRHHWDQIRRENARCSCPREEHSERLHQHLIPARLYGLTVWEHLRCLTGSLKGYACAHVLPRCRVSHSSGEKQRRVSQIQCNTMHRT